MRMKRLIAFVCVCWIIGVLGGPVDFPVPSEVVSESAEGYATNGVKAVWIESVPWKGKSTRIFAYYALPEGASPDAKAPGIVLVHGGWGTAFASWVKTWNDRGYAAIAMDTCGGVPGELSHCPEHPRHAGSGPNGWGRFEEADLPVEDQWPYHAVEAVIRAHTFLRNLPEVDASCIGVTGISWGGFLTSIVCGVDSRFAFAAPVYGCGNLRRHSVWSKEIGRRWDALWDPSHYVTNCRVPTLWCTGTNDHFFPLDSFVATARASGNPLFSIKLRMPHGHPPAGDPPEIVAFADSVVKGGPKLTAHTIVRTEWLSTESSDAVWERRPFVVTTNRPASATLSLRNTVTDSGLVLTDCSCELGDSAGDVTWQTLPMFCRSNVGQIKGPVRGIAVEHHGLGCGQFEENQVEAHGWLAEKGIVFIHPHYSPWAWMNRHAVKLTDDLVSTVKAHYRLPDDVPIVSYGGSMGGQGCLIWPCYSRHRISAVVANCPVTDLVYHYSERPDLPRTMGCAFEYADDLMEEIRRRSPFHQIGRMPDIPYTILHGTKDDEVSKRFHSDRFVAAMRQAGRTVAYEASEGMGHCKLSPHTQKVFDRALLAPFEKAEEK